MNAPIFEICAADTSVMNLIADGPTIRLYPFDEALQKDKLPYAVYQTIGGEPENCLSGVPSMDRISIAVDLFARKAADVYELRDAIIAAIEPYAHVVAWTGEDRDPETKAYVLGFVVDWFVER